MPHRPCVGDGVRERRPRARRCGVEALAMPSALVAALAAPIREMQSLVGPGWSSDRGSDPPPALVGVREARANVSAAARRGWMPAEVIWLGAGGDAASEFAAMTAGAADELA